MEQAFLVCFVFHVGNVCWRRGGAPQLTAQPLRGPRAEIVIWFSKPRDHRTGVGWGSWGRQSKIMRELKININKYAYINYIKMSR